MEVKATLLKQYGEQLVRVRYRYDKRKQKRYKTAEIIIEEKDWHPGVISYPDKRVFVRIGYGENTLRDLVKKHGGYWNPDKNAWHIVLKMVVELGLEERVIDEQLCRRFDIPYSVYILIMVCGKYMSTGRP